MMVSEFVGTLPRGMEFVVILLNVVVLVAIGYAILLVVRAVGGSPTRDLESRVTNLEG